MSNNKDNANPIVHAIKHSKRKSSIRFEEYSTNDNLSDEISRFYGDVDILGDISSDANGEEQICGSNISVNDKSILMALAACSSDDDNDDGASNSNIDTVWKIVQAAGFPIDVAKDRLLGPTQFRPAADLLTHYDHDRPEEQGLEDAATDEIDSNEIFEIIRDINDPEHPLTLEQLNVVSEDLVTVVRQSGHPMVDIRFT